MKEKLKDLRILFLAWFIYVIITSVIKWFWKMKELSIEEKAKAYNEVREKIALRFGSNVAEEIFSEFEMSEDEKIRKEIIYHIQNCDDTIDEETEKKMIAWLEKQGNSNTNIILKKAGIKPAYMDGNAWCVLYGDNIQDGICGFGDTKEEALVEFLKELLEKQGNSVKECLNLPHFTFDDVLALQCCMETVKKVQEDKELYEALSLLHGKVYDAYHLEKKTR